MAETLQFTVTLRDQLTPSLKKVQAELDKTTASTDKAADASKGKNFEFDKAGDKVSKLEQAAKSGEKTVQALNTTSGKTVSTMNSVGSATSAAAGKISEQGTATGKAASGWTKYKSAVETVTSKVGTAVSSAGQKFGTFVSSVRNAGAKAASGFQTALSPITSRASSVFSSVSNAARSFASRYAEAGRNIAAKFDQAFTTGMNAVKKTAEGIGAGIIGGLGVAMTKGFTRLSSIENAQAKLKGLGNDADTVTKIMDNAATSVEGTAYSLDAAATSAASAVAAGIKPGKDLTGYLKTVANTAATAGMSMEESGAIFGKVAATGVAYTDNVNMLADRGIPIWQKLSEVAGMSVGDTAKAITKGQISFEEFAKASELAVGSVADEMGGTFTGAWMNFNAALGRIGAEVLKGIFPALAAGMQGLTTVAKAVGRSLVPMSEALGSKLAPVAQQLNDYFTNLADSGMDGFVSKIQELTPALLPAMGALIGFGSAALKNLPLIGKFLPTLNPLVGLFLGIVAASPELRGALVDLGQTVASILIPAFEKIAPVLAVAFGGAAEIIGNVLGAVVGFIGQSKILTGVVLGVAGAIGAAVLAYKAYTAIMAVVQTATRLATAFTAGFTGAQAASTAMTRGQTAAQIAGTWAVKAWSVTTRIASAVAVGFGAALKFMLGPVGLIITGITLLVAGLVWFFTKTETGKAIWEATWNGIKAATAFVVDWFTNTALPALQGVWNGIVAGAQWMWNTVLKPIWSAMQIGFLIVATLVMSYWEFILKPVFNAIAAGALWLWNNGIKPAWDAIKLGWNLLVNGIKMYWEFVLKPVWNAVVAGAKWLWNNGVKPAFDGFKLGWNLLVTGIKFYWETVLKPAWNAVVAGAKWLWYNGVKPVVDAFKAGWAALGTGIRWVKDNVISPALHAVKTAGSNMWNGLSPIFDAVKRGIKAVGEGFQTAKAVIKTAWDGIKSAAKGPAEFVVNTVYNNGIRKIWNKAAGIFNMDDKKLPEVKMATGGHAHGRVLGRGTGTSDSIDAKLSNGEFVVNARATRRHLPLLHAINGPGGVGAKEFAQRSGAGVPATVGGVPAFASGGTLMNAADWWIGKGARGSEHPRFGRVGRHSRNSLHYSGNAVDLNYGPGGQNATEMSFFDRNVGAFKQAFPGIRVIWRAAGHYNHMHIDTSKGADIGSFSGGSGGAGGGSIFDVSPLSGLLSKITGFKNQAGDFGQGLLNSGKSLVQGALDKINPLNAMDTAVEGVKDVVTAGVGKARGIKWAVAQGWPLFGQRWKALDYIVSHESGWRPDAQNPSSTASGLGQFINSTARQYLGGSPMKRFPFDQQLKAVVAYTNDRYGGLVKAMQFWKSHRYYSQGGQVPEAPNVGVFDNGGMWQPGTLGFNAGTNSEMVLTNEQSQIITNGLRAMTASSSGGGATLAVENIDIRVEGDVYGIDDLDAYLAEAVEKLMVQIEREWEERR